MKAKGYGGLQIHFNSSIFPGDYGFRLLFLLAILAHIIFIYLFHNKVKDM